MRVLEVTPHPCLNCGQGNTADRREPQRFIDLERDVNWNDPVIFCEKCCLKIGALVGMVGEDGVKDLKRESRKKDREIHELKAEMDSMRVRARRMGMEFADEKVVA